MTASNARAIPANGEALPSDRFADDILRGADKIALFLYGDATKRRSIYHLAEKSKLPIFRLGSMVCARKSQIIAWVENQERASGERLGGAS